MKQGRTLMELEKELQRQRQNRQDFLADTRSLEMKSDSCSSTLRMSLDRHNYSFKIGDVVQAGFVVSNSEVGLGRLNVEPLISFSLVLRRAQNVRSSVKSAENDPNK